MKASGAGYSTTNSRGTTTMYKSSKDAPGYYDTQDGKNVPTSPGTAMGTLDATQIASSNKTGKVDPLTTPSSPTGIETPDMGEVTPGAINSNPTDARTEALSKLKGMGYASPDEGEISGMMDEMGALSAPKTNIQKGFEAATASGVGVPNGQAEARMQAQTYMPPEKAINPVDTILQQDEGLTGIVDLYKEFMSPENQRASLTDTYREMLQDTGIEDIDMDLIDMKNVIEGSEDDIRTEITKAGGFATESQVAAMTNARNKTLIKNYNTLLETRNAKSQYIDTMIGLEAQDRTYASQQFDRMMNFGFQMKTMQNQMKQNAQNQYYKIAEATGWDGLYNSAQAHGTTSLIEQTLGMPQGGLAQASMKAVQQQQMQMEEHQLDLASKRANIAQSYSSIETDKIQRAKAQYELDQLKNPVGLNKETRKEVVSSPEYKTISGAIPALKALTTYKDLIAQYGTAEKLDGAAQGKLQAAYGNALASWKTLAGLGALSGADFDLAENAVPKPSFFARQSTQTGKVTGSIDTALGQAEMLTQRLIQTYPEAQEFLQSQLDELKISSSPEKIVSWEMMNEMDSVLNP